MKILLFFLILNNSKPIKDTMVTAVPKYFIAMDYVGLSNCIYKVFVNDSTVMCAKVNGYITVSPSFGLGTVVPKNIMHDPEGYVSKKMDDKYSLAILSDRQKFLKSDRMNLIIKKSDILKVYHDPTKKWGMGYYPHNGKIMIKYKDPAVPETELILVGDQDVDDVLNLINIK